MQGNFKSDKGKIFSRLVSIDGEKIAIGNSFNKETGELSASNTIVLNANNGTTALNTQQSNSFYVSPIRSSTSSHKTLMYDDTNKEIVYSASAKTFVIKNERK